MKDPYKVLNISTTATDEEIKSAFRKIALETHPDKNGGDPKKTEMFREANDAYHFLLDKTQREAYDYYRESQSSVYSESFYEKKTAENKAKATQTERELHKAFMEAKENLQDMWFNILTGLGSLAFGIIVSFISSSIGSDKVYIGLIFVGAIGALKGLFGAVKALGKMASIKAKEKSIFGSGERSSHNDSSEKDNYSSKAESKGSPNYEGSTVRKEKTMEGKENDNDNASNQDKSKSRANETYDTADTKMSNGTKAILITCLVIIIIIIIYAVHLERTGTNNIVESKFKEGLYDTETFFEFMEGDWETSSGSYYFIASAENDTYYIQTNLPMGENQDYYWDVEDAVLYIQYAGKEEWFERLKFSVQDYNTVIIYSYQDNTKRTFYRQ